MFQAGDLLVYGTTGVCRVLSIDRRQERAAYAVCGMRRVVLVVPRCSDTVGGATMGHGRWARVVGFALLSVGQTEIAKAIGRWRARR